MNIRAIGVNDMSKFVCFLMILFGLGAISTPAKAATLDAAVRYYDEKDYKSAAAEYGTLLTFNWPKTKVGELYDRFTECLTIIGNNELADAKIDVFLKMMPDDPVAPKLALRKIQVARNRGDEALAEKLAGEFATTYPSQTELCAKAQQLTVVTTSPQVDIGAADQNYAQGDYVEAAKYYQALLDRRDATASAEIVDKATECLTIVGKYSAAREKIDTYLGSHTTDSLTEKLIARKVRLAYYSNDFTSSSELAKYYLARFDKTTTWGLQTQRTLVDSLSKSGRHQVQIDFIETELSANPAHPLYAEFRRRQADTLSRMLKQNDAACLKYRDAFTHAAPDGETYETCAYRLSEITQSQAAALAKTDPKKSDELTSASRSYLSEFLNHPGADKIYPANAKRRLSALRKLKQYDIMEQEAANYLSKDNHVHPIEIISIKNIIGPLIDFQHTSDPDISPEDQIKIRQMKAAYYGDDFAGAIAQAKEFLSSRSADTVAYQRAQGVLIMSLSKNKNTQELVDYVDQALTANPMHPQYADIRRVQADALFGAKKDADARVKYVDVMAHSSNDSEAYEWSCYRAGDSMYRQAAALYEINSQQNAALKVEGRKFLQEYVTLPSKDAIYPGNVRRRMLALIRLGQTDQMELEAAHYLTDLGVYNNEDYMAIMRILSTNRAMKPNPDQQGAFAAFEELRVRENNFTDNNAKVYCGLTMLKSAQYFAGHGGVKEQVDKLRETGRRFLQDATKDEGLKLSNRMDAYYFLQDWPALKTEASKNLEQAAVEDSVLRAEMLNWIGIALANQHPQDIDGAVASFDKTLQEYEKSPQLVGHRGMTAAYWAVWLRASQKDTAGAKVYYQKAIALPDCDMKTKLTKEFGYLASN